MTSAGGTPNAEVPVSEWLNAFVPLGSYGDESWSPAGAGVLIVDLPVVWLVTSKSLVQQAAEQQAPLAAFLSREEGGAILDLGESQAASGLGWIEHEDLDLAATLFPVNPAWKIKAFAQQQCAPAAELHALLPVCSLVCPYGLAPTERPQPFVLTGTISHVSGPLLYTSAPLLAQNRGAPLVLGSGLGGKIQLAGILTQSLLVPEPDPRVPPVRLSVAVGMEEVWSLVRGPAAVAQRAQVSAAAKAPEEA